MNRSTPGTTIFYDNCRSLEPSPAQLMRKTGSFRVLTPKNGDLARKVDGIGILQKISAPMNRDNFLHRRSTVNKRVNGLFEECYRN